MMWRDQHCTHLYCSSNQSIFSINLKSQLSKSHQRCSLPTNDHQLPTDFKLEFFSRSSKVDPIWCWCSVDHYRIFPANIWSDLSSKYLTRYFQQIFDVALPCLMLVFEPDWTLKVTVLTVNLKSALYLPLLSDISPHNYIQNRIYIS